MPVGLPDRRRAMRQPRANRRRRLPARLRSPDAPHPPGRRGPRPVPRVRVGRAAAPVRAPLHAAERRALLPDERAHRPRGELRRGPARRRRDAAAERRRPVPDDRDAARLRRQQGQLRERSEPRARRPTTGTPTTSRAAATRSSTPARAASAGPAGSPPRARPTARAGWIHLADQRYEARDTQHLLGLLVDQGVARPGALGVTGISYGGGQSLELAFLRDRIRNPDGSFAPWRSPKGTAAVDRRGLSALAVVGPRQRAAAQRALPRLPRLERDREPRADRRADPVLHLRALRLRRGVGLLRAAGARRGR